MPAIRGPIRTKQINQIANSIRQFGRVVRELSDKVGELTGVETIIRSSLAALFGKK